ncbi:MAG: tyrosine-type recombinase/integrase [Galactobacter sp.]
MAQVVDRWHRKDRTRTTRYGVGYRWVVVYTDPGGVRKRKGFRTKDEAEAFLAATVSAVNTGSYIPPEKQQLTFGQLWPTLEQTKAGRSRKTREMYTLTWERFIAPRWEHEQVRTVTRSAISAWLPTLRTGDGEPISASYERQTLATLRQLLDIAIDERAIDRNPAAKTPTRRIPASQRRVLTVAQADAIVAAMAPHGLMVRVLLHTGLRRGEVAGLKVEDLDTRRKRLRVRRDIDDLGAEDETKNHTHRDVPIRGALLDDLKEAARGRPRDEYLFPSPKGGAWTTSMWRRRWKAARTAIGLADLDTHELRHTAVSWAIHAGANVKDIQRMVGHSSAALTLDTYGHLWDDNLDTVAERLDTFIDQLRAEEKAAAEHPQRRAPGGGL